MRSRADILLLLVSLLCIGDDNANILPLFGDQIQLLEQSHDDNELLADVSSWVTQVDKLTKQ